MVADKNETVVTSTGPSIRFAAVVLALALLGVAIVSRLALLTVLIDGFAALLVVGPFALAGLWLVPLFRTGPMPVRWHLMLGAALGLGCASLLILLLGLAGFLDRSLWVAIVAVAGVAGVVRLRLLLGGQTAAATKEQNTPRRERDKSRYLWLITAPFFSLALLAASNAPGFIWSEEGYGYDVLEYHLQVPKEYRQAGAIEYLPHNVYANFPANVEMLYMLSMVLLDDDVETGCAAHMIHLLLGALTVFAAWVVGCEWSRRAGMVCAISLATVGWLMYLSGLAYVENGLLFFGLVAAGATLRAVEGSKGTGWVVLAGVCAGFACGCKYTGVPMIAMACAAGILFAGSGSIGRKARCSLLFALATAVALSPWLIKNQVMTGNPVFPLANSLFDASPEGWDDDSTSRWDRGHTPAPDERTIVARLGALWTHVPGDHYQRFGPAILILGIGGLAWRRLDKVDRMLLAVLVVQLAVWLFATHLYARFATVMLIPLALLAGRAIGQGTGQRVRVVMGIVVAGAIWNFGFAAGLSHAESPGGAPASMFYDGKLAFYEYFDTVNNDLPAESRLLLVGDAKAFYFRRAVDYCVVFNKDPFASAVRGSQTDREIVDWLRGRGYTHVLVNWAEISRLRGSRYGFAPEITPDLFDRLVGSGLSVLREFPHPQGTRRYVTLYRVDSD